MIVTKPRGGSVVVYENLLVRPRKNEEYNVLVEGRGRTRSQISKAVRAALGDRVAVHFEAPGHYDTGQLVELDC